VKQLSAIRIAGPITAVSLLLFLVGASGAWYVHSLQRSTSTMLDHNVSSIRAAVEVELRVRELRTELNRFLLYDDEHHLDKANGEIPEINHWLDRAKQCATSVDEQKLMQELEANVVRLFEKLDEIRLDLDPARKKDAITRLTQELLTENILAAAREYLDINEKDLEYSREESRNMTGNVMLGLTLLGACGSVAGLLAGYGMARAVNRSIFHLSVPIRDVAGKLNEVVGPITVSADPRIEDLQLVLGKVSEEVAAVVDQLQGAHREMVRADQLAAVGQMAAGLAHELRNPLMAMKLLVQSASRTDGATQNLSRRDLKILDEEITRLEDLLQSFLNFARPARLETQLLDLRTLVAPSLQLLSHRAALKDVDVRTCLSDSACLVEADSSQIRQVLVNLLLNALEAAPRGGVVEVHISRSAVSTKGSLLGRRTPADSVELRVADSGDGLPAAVHERIFEPFFSTRETGLGLGLAICKRIVESHGGVITAENRPEGGALFTARLPAAGPAAGSTVDGVASSTRSGSEKKKECATWPRS
jgi:signal transduction histidine kinase/CHASE3 domain sensor protein